MKVFVSDEIADKIDTGQFYENPPDEDITASLWIEDGPIVVKLKTLKIYGNRIKMSFLCESDIAFPFLQSKAIKNVSVYKAREPKPVMEFNKLEIISKSFKMSSAGIHECDLNAMLDNM